MSAGKNLFVRSTRRQRLFKQLTALPLPPSHVPMVQSVEIIENLSAVLLVEPYKAKLQNVIQNNPDYAKMEELKNILDGKDVSTQSGISPLLAPLYKFVPMSSADIERVFSSMGDVTSPKRRSLTVEHLKFNVILYWNTFEKK